MSFFDRVKDCVKEQNISIEEFLNDVFCGEVSRDVYNGWRRRQNLPRADQAVKIARGLKVSVEFLVTGTGPMGLPPDIAALCRDMVLLSEDDKDDIRSLVSAKLDRISKLTERRKGA